MDIISVKAWRRISASFLSSVCALLQVSNLGSQIGERQGELDCLCQNDRMPSLSSMLLLELNSTSRTLKKKKKEKTLQLIMNMQSTHNESMIKPCQKIIFRALRVNYQMYDRKPSFSNLCFVFSGGAHFQTRLHTF